MFQIIAIYKIEGKEPELRLRPLECMALTIGSVDFGNFFHKLVEERIVGFLDGTDQSSQEVLAEFDKVPIYLHSVSSFPIR